MSHALAFTGTLPFQQQPQRPYIALAPMEGLMDHHLRDILTRVGGIDHCVTEFIRVTEQVYPAKVFRRYCPELDNGGRTPAGTPVHIQLLGSDPFLMAANARKAARLGAPAIDLNFGCPAKTVNRSQGGAVLLQYPDLLHRIARAVREAVGPEIPVSAKMRLGYLDKDNALENALALAEGGIQWLTVHARTKTEGYKPPAYWDWIARIKEVVAIPVIANGEIWTPAQAQQCMQESGSDLIMIGRGLVSVPDLAMQIKAAHGLVEHTTHSWQQKLELFLQLVPKLDDLRDKSLTDRLKQWLHYFNLHSPEIAAIFEAVKRERDRETFLGRIRELSAEMSASNSTNNIFQGEHR
ncbi:tRNA dihydrouridine(16) synthase DusC [Venatoribacter cucullus]|uniref:tRNA-dihydrouridine(16) synthase n=1 Tax=Venatoribacter cucullus TaxID=2661630 RepID=A0A9X7YPM5_9GAMM|nr:tRNA-dihydrouridine synthase family protein [Venatoribacter cucullus]QQD24886.1 tRNA dihydrouridine(16) synthase DusC [Venatoribacter cucullus]